MIEGRKPFADLIGFLKENSVFKEVSCHTPEKIDAEMKEKLKSLEAELSFTFDCSLDGIKSIACLLSWAKPEDDLFISSDELWKVGEIIENLSELAENCENTRVWLNHAQKARLEYELNQAKGGAR